MFIGVSPLVRFTSGHLSFKVLECSVCMSQEDSGRLVCCRGCSLTVHHYCVIPLISKPIPNWVCPSCAPKYLKYRSNPSNNINSTPSALSQPSPSSPSSPPSPSSSSSTSASSPSSS